MEVPTLGILGAGERTPQKKEKEKKDKKKSFKDLLVSKGEEAASAPVPAAEEKEEPKKGKFVNFVA